MQPDLNTYVVTFAIFHAVHIVRHGRPCESLTTHPTYSTQRKKSKKGKAPTTTPKHKMTFTQISNLALVHRPFAQSNHHGIHPEVVMNKRTHTEKPTKRHDQKVMAVL